MQSSNPDVASTTRKETAAADLGPPVVSRVTGDLANFQPPVGCRASVLVRQVSRTPNPDGTGTRTCICWLSVGRFQAQAFKISYHHDGAEVFLVNVRDGSWLDVDYLQDEIARFLENDEHLPGDTVVIKK